MRFVIEIEKNVWFSLKTDHLYLTGVQKNSDGDVYLATMLAIKLYTKLLEDPQMAFCGLYTDLESINGLHRAGTVFLFGDFLHAVLGFQWQASVLLE